jgi:hypothetical protein
MCAALPLYPNPRLTLILKFWYASSNDVPITFIVLVTQTLLLTSIALYRNIREAGKKVYPFQLKKKMIM